MNEELKNEPMAGWQEFNGKTTENKNKSTYLDLLMRRIEL
jgi:hypothetical protein|tara:strand:- start:19187 stop:19306 length:120 start_codon:yes stop_codon:yes gene_type:complete